MPLRKLKTPDNATAEDLIRTIERKDRNFRLFQTLFMVGTFLALIVIISAQQRTLDGLHDQAANSEKVAAAAAKQSYEQQQTILRRLDCMSVFFSQKDRTNLSIDNIDQCTLSRDGDIQQFFTQQPGQAPETTRDPQNLPDSTTSTPGVVQNSNNGDKPVQDDNEVIEPRPPLTLDLPLVNTPPVCVDLVGVCIR